VYLRSQTVATYSLTGPDDSHGSTDDTLNTKNSVNLPVNSLRPEGAVWTSVTGAAASVGILVVGVTFARLSRILMPVVVGTITYLPAQSSHKPN
jgi:hypothetical protein